MTRDEVEKDYNVSTLSKLIIEWLSRQPAKPYSSREVAEALGVFAPGVVSDESYFMRRKKLLVSEYNGDHIPIGQLMLAAGVRAAYCPVEPSTKDKKK
jgi:hypothetical protein